MPLVRAQVSFQGASGISRDRFVNTFYFAMTDPEPPSADFPSIAAALKAFWSTPAAEASATIASRMAALADAAGSTIKLYDTANPPHTGPIYSEEFTPSFGEQRPLPQEIACCLSYMNTTATLVPPARRRGRIYIGPLNITAGGGATSAVHSRVDPNFMDDLTKAGAGLLATAATLGWQWMVYSPTDNVSRNIERFWVDNEWDVQRRRGQRADARITVNV